MDDNVNPTMCLRVIIHKEHSFPSKIPSMAHDKKLPTRAFAQVCVSHTIDDETQVPYATLLVLVGQ